MSIKQSLSTKSRKLSPPEKRKDGSNESYYEAIFFLVFDNLDEEISTVDELMLLLQYAGYNPSKKTIGKYWDSNTESYNFNQFCSILKQEENSANQDLMKAFKKIDRSGDGYITHDELSQLLTKGGERMTKAEVKSMFEDADFNGDGKLDYTEFCSLMDMTSKQCKQLYVSNHSKNLDSKKSKDKIKSDIESPTKDKRNSIKMQEQKKLSLADIATKSPKSNRNDSIETKPKSKEDVKKLEPMDLSKWKFESSKGCFYKEDDGSITSHRFQLKITQPTTVWITTKVIAPKYGKFSDNILQSDITIFLVEKTSGKLISFSDVEVDDKICLLADVDIGVYRIIMFSSGIKLQAQDTESGRVSLGKGTGDDCRLTRLCKNSLMEIFYRCDLDGNGFLNRQEFNQFQMRSSGEECDDDAWEVVKETVDLTPQTEITLKGFLDLNLLELRDPDGGQDELWITLESLGYSNKLLLTTACPFVLEVFTRKGQNELTLLGVSDGGHELQDIIIESIKMTSNIKPIKNKRDLHLHVAKFGTRTSIAVDNQSHGAIKVQVDCSASENFVSSRGKMDTTVELDSKVMSIVHHLVPDNKDVVSKLKYQESIIR